MGKSLNGWLTAQEVADRYGIEARAVVRMIRSGRIDAQKKGWVWLIHVSDLPQGWPPPVRVPA